MYSVYDAGMPSAPSSSSYCLPAKYGGEVTTSATDEGCTRSIERASPRYISSTTPGARTVASSDSTGGENRL